MMSGHLRRSRELEVVRHRRFQEHRRRHCRRKMFHGLAAGRRTLGGFLGALLVLHDGLRLKKSKTNYIGLPLVGTIQGRTRYPTLASL